MCSSVPVRQAWVFFPQLCSIHNAKPSIIYVNSAWQLRPRDSMQLMIISSITAVTITTHCLLFRMPSLQKCCWRQRMATVEINRKGESVRESVRKERLSVWQPDPFFHSLCASSEAHSWSFRLLGGRREAFAHTKQRSLLCCLKRKGREGGREG